MTPASKDQPNQPRPLRLWPGIVAVLLQWFAFFVLPVIQPDYLIYGIFGSLGLGAVILLWWALFSRASHIERWGALILAVGSAFLTGRLVDKSIATGAMGFLYLGLAVPVMSMAFVLGAAVSNRLSGGLRRVTFGTAILFGCIVLASLRTNGIGGKMGFDLAFRWSKTSEEKLLAKAGNQLSALPSLPPAVPPAPLPAETPVEKPAAHKATERPATPPSTPAPVDAVAIWPGFRGPGRDSIIPGTRIKTDWSASPPVKLWTREIGPGWSSFAISTDRIYTQEQRGEDEYVTCYNANTGNPVWAHHDAARFWESNAGAGPRATPTLDHGRVYSFGATGILNALDAGNGAVLWSRNAASDAGVKIPGWGFASSPLIVGDMVIVAVAGKLAAYDLSSGAPRWFGPDGGDSYSSPHLATIDGVTQIVLMSADGATSVSPEDGKQIWKYSWKSTTRILQPAVTADGNLLITTGDAMGGEGMRRIGVLHGPAGWTVEERWTSPVIRSNFNDSIIHNGYLYGFSGAILACIDLKDGSRKWKGGRYGDGQIVLLRDQDLLLVISEEGDIALVKATPDQFTEVAHIPALEGKTWNHPAVAGDRLLVRNSSEMAAFRLPMSGG